MEHTKNIGYLINRIKLLNGRLFNKLLSDTNAVYNGEQGKILTQLWNKEPLTATDLSITTGLANNTLTNMLKKMEEQNLIYSKPHKTDLRKKLFFLTELGKKQEIFGSKASEELDNILYKNFSKEEINQLENGLNKVLINLLSQENRWKN